MLEPLDQLRARFAPKDKVAFSYRRKTLEGLLLRTNQTCGVVLVGHRQFHVPYERLESRECGTQHRIDQIMCVNQLALELIDLHGLKKWRFRFDHSTRRAGSCRYHDRTITLAFDLARSGTDEDIRDTILHEIAHALTGPRHNHDAVWQAKAKEIGCSGKRTHQLRFSPPRWLVTCENNCWTHTAQQRNKRLVCRQCGGRPVYSPYPAEA